MSKIKFILSIILILLTKIPHQFGISDPAINTFKNYQDDETPSKFNPNERLIIVGLGNVDIATLHFAQRVVREFFRFPTTIRLDYLPIKDKYYYDVYRVDINSDAVVRDFQSYDRMLIITNKPMKVSDPDELSVRGYTTVKGKIMIVRQGTFMKETIIHEIGHTYGLLHCPNLFCIMAINNDNYDSGTFCGQCRLKINYY